MARHSTIAIRIASREVQAVVACVVGVVLATAPLAARGADATPQALVIPDPDGLAENAELGRAVAFLVRSALSEDMHIRVVPRRELELAVGSLGKKQSGDSLIVPDDEAVKLLDRMQADAIVPWRLEVDDKGTLATGTMLGPAGKRLLRIRVAAATGDVAELARKMASRIAVARSAASGAIPETGIAELRPFLALEAAMLASDSVAAYRAVELASSGVVVKIAEARKTLQVLAEHTGMAALPRAQARLLRSEWAAAAATADDGLAADPKNVLLRVVKVRALVATNALALAASELATVRASRNASAVAVASLALALARGGSVDEHDAALALLVGRPAVEWRAVLPLIAETSPGSFGPKIEAAALAAAEKLMAQEPGLASLLAIRALAAAGIGGRAAPLVNVRELSAEQVAAISARLAAQADASSVDLSRQIIRRKEEAKAIAVDAGVVRPNGQPSALARNLKIILEEFDALYDPSLSSIQVAALPGTGQPFYWPFLVRSQRMREGLLEALLRSPWDLNATTSKIETELLPPERLSDEGIATLAAELGASALLLYRVRPASLAPWATVDLILYDAAHQRSQRIEASLVGRPTGVMVLNPLVIAVGVLAGLALLGWMVVISLRGTIAVRVQWDADAKDELFSLLVSRTPTTPAIENIAAYRKKLEWLGERKRRFEAWNVEQNTTFRGIPRGTWYVHLYGIYTRGRQTMLLHEPPQEVQVLPRKTAFVAHVLEAAEAEFKILVLDDRGPVEGARVWLDDDRARGATTAKAGLASVKVTKGFHVIRVNAHGMTVDRPYHVVKAKVHDMTINLVWERRQEYVSRALERQVDDVAEYTRKRRAPQTQASPAASTSSTLLSAVPTTDVAPSLSVESSTDPGSAVAPVDLPSSDLPLGDAVETPLDLPPPLDLDGAAPANRQVSQPMLSLKPLKFEGGRIPPSSAKPRH